MACVSTSGRDRKVLEGVPRVNFYAGGERCPEDVPFPSCLRAVLEYLGDDLVHCKEALLAGRRRPRGCCYAYLMGASGAAFRLLWNAERWDGANVDLSAMSEDPLEPFQRTFEAVGYSHEFHVKGANGADEAFLRRALVESIRDRGRPALALGVVGPPESCIITGYDDDGEVLLGWSFFQNNPEYNGGVEFEPSGYFRKRDWYANTDAVILLGEKTGRPEPETVLRSAVERALRMLETPRVGPRYCGLAAYDAWADFIRRDGEFPAGDMAVLRERYVAHNDAVGAVAEGRWYASRFLQDMASEVPWATAGLLKAAACYEAEHDLMWKLWGLLGGHGWNDEYARRLAEPEVRAQSAEIIGQARAKDARAAEHLAKTLGM